MVALKPDDDPILCEIVRRLVEAYDPQEIRLFGSKARGDDDADSDYDVMVLVPDDAPEEKRRSLLAYQSLTGVGRAADVLVWHRDRFYRRSRVVCSLPATVLREGKLLYARV